MEFRTKSIEGLGGGDFPIIEFLQVPERDTAAQCCDIRQLSGDMTGIKTV